MSVKTKVDTSTYRKTSKRGEINQQIAKGAAFVLLILGAVLFMIPLYVMIVMSFKTPTELAISSPWELPKDWTWENYRVVLTNPNANFRLFFRNSLITSLVPTIGVMFSSAMVAYPFARLRFRGRDRLFLLVLSTMMLPGVVTMIPQYVLYKHLHWVDTFYPLTVPAYFGGGAWNIFLFRQFFMGLPRELDEAAVLDGANYSTIFWRVILPNSGAAMATIGIFSFVFNWRDFMGPLLYLNDPDKQPLELGLRTYQSLNSERWELLMAGSVLVMIPIAIIFIAGQRYFVKGIAMTGIK